MLRNHILIFVAWNKGLVGRGTGTQSATFFRTMYSSVRYCVSASARIDDSSCFSVGILLITLLIAGCSAEAPTPNKANSMSASQTYPCNDPVAERAATLAREKFPDSLPSFNRRSGRNLFLERNMWRLFDVNHDGRIDFSEFLSSEWATYLVQASPGECRVTKSEYLDLFLGQPGDPDSAWKLAWTVKIIKCDYNRLDASHKGYITKNDIVADERAMFDHLKKIDGYRIEDDFGVKSALLK